MGNTIKMNGKETELRFVYDDGAYAYFNTWNDLVKNWKDVYGNDTDAHFRNYAHGTIVAGSIGHSVPLVSAEHSGVCSAAEKNALMEKAKAAYPDLVTVE